MSRPARADDGRGSDTRHRASDPAGVSRGGRGSKASRVKRATGDRAEPHADRVPAKREGRAKRKRPKRAAGPRMITAEVAAVTLGVCERTMRRNCDARLFGARKIRGRWYVERHHFETPLHAVALTLAELDALARDRWDRVETIEAEPRPSDPAARLEQLREWVVASYVAEPQKNRKAVWREVLTRLL